MVVISSFPGSCQAVNEEGKMVMRPARNVDARFPTFSIEMPSSTPGWTGLGIECRNFLNCRDPDAGVVFYQKVPENGPGPNRALNRFTYSPTSQEAAL